MLKDILKSIKGPQVHSKIDTTDSQWVVRQSLAKARGLVCGPESNF